MEVTTMSYPKCKTVSMPKVGLLIFLFWTPHFVVRTSHFGWTPRLNCTVYYVVCYSAVYYVVCYSAGNCLFLHSADVNLVAVYCPVQRSPSETDRQC